jgi:hypothetical protein
MAAHDHLARKLHPATSKLEIADRARIEATQPAMEVAELRLEKGPTYKTQKRIAKPAMERGHGPRLNSAFEPISHNKIVPFSQFGHEFIELRKVVRIVSVTHDHETAFAASIPPVRTAP